MSLFKYYNEEIPMGECSRCIIELPSGIDSKEDLLNWYSDALSFPDYFGMNWDALSDCLRDLEWVKEQQVIIVHKYLPKLKEKDLSIYLKILHEAVEDWAQNEQHDLLVLFPESLHVNIEKVIS
jgi:RNAse (barnase) inhibitor barstar